MTTNDTLRASTPATQATPVQSPFSDATRVETLIRSVEADLDYIIYKSTDPRAHEFACNAKRKIAALRASATNSDSKVP